MTAEEFTKSVEKVIQDKDEEINQYNEQVTQLKEDIGQLKRKGKYTKLKMTHNVMETLFRANEIQSFYTSSYLSIKKYERL